jgi:hypothetical protein
MLMLEARDPPRTLRDSRTGTTHHAQAESYGISVSSVKRLLRRYRY